MTELARKKEEICALVVKEFEEKYASQVGKLISTIQQEEFGVSITLEEQPDLLNIKDFYQNKTGNFWLALNGDTLVGTIALLDIGNGQAALRKMFVDKDFRGRQIGTARRLLDELLDWSRKKDIKDVFLGTTEKFHAAHRFYEKTGFVEISKKSLPGSFPVMFVDTKFYRMHLGLKDAN